MGDCSALTTGFAAESAEERWATKDGLACLMEVHAVSLASRREKGQERRPGLPDGGARCERYLPPLPVPNSWLPFVWRSSGHELLFQQSVGSLESADLWLVLWAGLHIPRCTVWLLSFKKKKSDENLK